MYRLKIYGAGSIGNHHAHAARQLGWAVSVCDVSAVALARMENDIYPQRYGRWDDAIRLYNVKDAPVGGFDLVIVGTPPEFHLSLALEALDEEPGAILIEKPLCPPSLERAQELVERSQRSGTKLFVGYDHVVGQAMRQTEELLRSGVIGEVQTIDVEFREHWGGIFAAHPWLSGPADSYLGFWRKGGGASGEHSHAANLWQHLAHVVGAGRVTTVHAMLRYLHEGGGEYDALCLLDLITEGGLVGRVVQDVVTTPPRKWARVQGSAGAIEWLANYNAEGDAVRYVRPGHNDEVFPVRKKRPDDFIQELEHVREQISGPAAPSGIRLQRGLDTMLVVAAAHRSESEQCRVRIDYGGGYTLDALQPCGA